MQKQNVSYYGFLIPTNNDNEIFVNTENPLFDRNRVYAALGFVINKNFKVEAGFMSQILEQSNRNQFQIVIFNNLPFKN